MEAAEPTAEELLQISLREQERPLALITKPPRQDPTVPSATQNLLVHYGLGGSVSKTERIEEEFRKGYLQGIQGVKKKEFKLRRAKPRYKGLEKVARMAPPEGDLAPLKLRPFTREQLTSAFLLVPGQTLFSKHK
mmetsp:Transcript_6084/g.6641  ORF Transcript_6084/g.6641 Transcript_6084/m.6641 type:complete len:135 (+) Transcript_6084:6-410(+)